MRSGVILLIALVCVATGTMSVLQPGHAQVNAAPYSMRWDKNGEGADKKAAHDTVVIYLHGRSGNSMEDAPVPLVIDLLASRLGAGMARIIRPPALDHVSHDPEIVAHIRARARELRDAGVRHILLAGASRGGWLAIKGGHEIPEVDEVLAIAPATSGLTSPELEAQAAAINEMLSSMQARRVALFFFKNDPREAVMRKRGDSGRAALRDSPASFLIEDQPEGLAGHGAVGMGRFSRRYLECLARFFAADSLPRGEHHCDKSSGYAVASEIMFPNAVPASPRDVTASVLRPFTGRWEGDDEYGRYWILVSSEFFEQGTTFLVGHSPAPGNKSVKPWVAELKFTPSASDPGILEHVSDRMKATISLKLLAGGDLEVTTKFWGNDRQYAPARLPLSVRQ
jgi:pimeloyl-ACP methyl ester carboxylesterase